MDPVLLPRSPKVKIFEGRGAAELATTANDWLQATGAQLVSVSGPTLLDTAGNYVMTILYHPAVEYPDYDTEHTGSPA